MAHRQFDGQELYNFLWRWRQRIVRRTDHSDEEFGQLITLNTILAYIDDKAAISRSVPERGADEAEGQEAHRSREAAPTTPQA